MIELTIKPQDIDRINKLLVDLSPKKQGGVIHKGMLKASSTVLGQLVANVSGDILHRRTGNLARSMGYRIDRDGDGIPQSTIGSGATLKTARMVYANIHEVGGVITPKRAKWLTIPLAAAQTPAGVARFSAREAKGMFDKTFFRTSQAGNLILFGTKGDEVIPLFVLKKSVTIPARRYMSITVEQTKERVVEDIVDKIREVKDKA